MSNSIAPRDIADPMSQQIFPPEFEWSAQHTIDALSSHICILDSAGVILRANRAWRDFAAANGAAPITGFEGMNYIEICRGAAGPNAGEAGPFAAGIRAVMTRELDEYTLDYTCHSPSERRWFVGRVTRYPGSGPVRVVVTHTDITRRKLAEEAMRKSDERFQDLFTTMTDGFALHEIIPDETGNPVDYRFLAVNPAFETLTGLRASDLIGRTVLEVLPGIEPDWIETFGRVAQSGEPVSFENFSRDLNRFYRVTAYRPAPGQFACIFDDITSRKRAEEERTRLAVKLHEAQKLESVGRLAGGVAHDFNNLLSPILCYTDLLLMESTPDEPRYKRLEQIRYAAERARELIGHLLAFGRKQVLLLKPIDLSDVLSDFMKLMRHTVREDIQIGVRLPETPVTVHADAGQIEQVLMNLVVNAQDAMPAGGILTLELSETILDEEDANRRQGVKPGPYALLVVGDTGQGMDQATIEHIFEPFFTTKESGKGTGLGLSTVYGIVKQHGGSIEVCSGPGRGSAFKIYLPWTEGAPESENPIVAEKSGDDLPGGSESILLVEDNQALREMACQVLLRQGYDITTAESGEDAFEALKTREKPIHLLLTDVIMPGINGRELHERLAADRPGLKVLYMSGYPGDVIAHHRVIGEEIDFLEKPFSVKTLVRKVREILDNGG